MDGGEWFICILKIWVDHVPHLRVTKSRDPMYCPGTALYSGPAPPIHFQNVSKVHRVVYYHSPSFVN